MTIGTSWGGDGPPLTSPSHAPHKHDHNEPFVTSYDHSIVAYQILSGVLWWFGREATLTVPRPEFPAIRTPNTPTALHSIPWQTAPSYSVPVPHIQAYSHVHRGLLDALSHTLSAIEMRPATVAVPNRRRESAPISITIDKNNRDSGRTPSASSTSSTPNSASILCPSSASGFTVRFIQPILADFYCQSQPSPPLPSDSSQVGSSSQATSTKLPYTYATSLTGKEKEKGKEKTILAGPLSIVPPHHSSASSSQSPSFAPNASRTASPSSSTNSPSGTTRTPRRGRRRSRSRSRSRPRSAPSSPTSSRPSAAASPGPRWRPKPQAPEDNEEKSSVSRPDPRVPSCTSPDTTAVPASSVSITIAATSTTPSPTLTPTPTPTLLSVPAPVPSPVHKPLQSPSSSSVPQTSWPAPLKSNQLAVSWSEMTDEEEEEKEDNVTQSQSIAVSRSAFLVESAITPAPHSNPIAKLTDNPFAALAAASATLDADSAEEQARPPSPHVRFTLPSPLSPPPHHSPTPADAPPTAAPTDSVPAGTDTGFIIVKSKAKQKEEDRMKKNQAPLNFDQMFLPIPEPVLILTGAGIGPLTRSRSHSQDHVRSDKLCYVCRTYPALDHDDELKGKERDEFWRSNAYCFRCVMYGLLMLSPWPTRKALPFEKRRLEQDEKARSKLFALWRKRTWSNHKPEGWLTRLEQMEPHLKADEYWKRRVAPKAEWERDAALHQYHMKKEKELDMQSPAVAAVAAVVHKKSGEAERTVPVVGSAPTQ